MAVVINVRLKQISLIPVQVNAFHSAKLTNVLLDTNVLCLLTLRPRNFVKKLVHLWPSLTLPTEVVLTSRHQLGDDIYKGMTCYTQFRWEKTLIRSKIKTLFQHEVHLTKKCSPMEPCITTTITNKNSRITVYII